MPQFFTIIYWCLFFVSAVSCFVIPLELALRAGAFSLFPNFGVCTRRVAVNVPFEQLKQQAEKRSDVLPVSLGDDRLIISRKLVRCLVERVDLQDSRLTFRFPVSLIAFIAVVPIATIMSGIERAIGNAASLLGSIFLLCFVSFICWLFFIGFKGEAAKDANRLMLALNISSAKIQ